PMRNGKAETLQSEQPRFTSSDIDYEKKYAPDAYDSQNARVWSVYNDEAQIADGERVQTLNGTLDVLLVFAGLFSAVVTTFVAQSSQALNPDYAQITASLVYELVRLQRAAASGDTGNVPTSLPSLEDRTYKTSDLWVNGLWLASLIFSLLTALIAVLAKQWIQRWRVPSIIGFLPALLTIALLLFFAGLAVYVAPMDATLCFVVIGFSSTASVAYGVTAILPIFIPHCAYKTPVSDYMVSCGSASLHLVYCLAEVVERLRRDRLFTMRYIYNSGSHWTSSHWRLPPLRSRESSDVKTKHDSLTVDVLRWLIKSSFNPHAASISVQAAAAI
ncbi:hypothetical protein EV714DRAFT_171163, partial [Schizophyllum commune]